MGWNVLEMDREKNVGTILLRRLDLAEILGLGLQVDNPRGVSYFCTARANDFWTARIGNIFKGALLCHRDTLVKFWISD